MDKCIISSEGALIAITPYDYTATHFLSTHLPPSPQTELNPIILSHTGHTGRHTLAPAQRWSAYRTGFDKCLSENILAFVFSDTYVQIDWNDNDMYTQISSKQSCAINLYKINTISTSLFASILIGGRLAGWGGIVLGGALLFWFHV